MKISCDTCKETGKGSYTTRWEDGKPVTECDECRYGKGLIRLGKSDKRIFDDIQTPFWKIMGQKPKPKDIRYEKYLKDHNMTYGDAVKLRNINATQKSSYEQFKKTH